MVYMKIQFNSIEDEINVPMALGVFRDGMVYNYNHTY